MNVILCTRNPSKIQQIRQLFEGSSITILNMTDLLDGEAIEDGETLEENALKKARFAIGHVANAWTMADDTGVFINALHGEPGVQAAYWAGRDVPTEQFTQFIVDKLKDVKDRSATFRTVVALISPDGEEHIFSGEVKGHFLEESRVPPQLKMPYSPLFMPDGEDKTWAEMTTEYENSISHRGKAFRQARAFLEKVA